MTSSSHATYEAAALWIPHGPRTTSGKPLERSSQRSVLEHQAEFAAQQEVAAMREQRIFWIALATLVVTTVGVLVALLP